MNAAHRHHLVSHSQSRNPLVPSPPVSSSPGGIYGQWEEPSPASTTPGSNIVTSEHSEASPAKRQRASGEASKNSQATYSTANATTKTSRSNSTVTLSPTDARRTSVDGLGDGKPPTATNPKSRRVRTGCLTCRERHLKCDEGAPVCLNCRKSNRECKRGMRLNFIDTQCKDPPMIPQTLEWSVQFQDESRLIASEYQGGLGRYAKFDQKHMTPPREMELDMVLQRQRSMENPDHIAASQAIYDRVGPRRPSSDMSGYDNGQRHGLQSRRASEVFAAGPPPIPGPGHGGTYTLSNVNDHLNLKDEAGPRSNIHRNSAASISSSMIPHASGASSFRPGGLGTDRRNMTPDGLMTPPNERNTGERDFLSSSEEIHFMQVFVNDVAVWMDSLDSEKHFSRVVPYLALKSPMLLNAFLACGVKHLTLTASYNDEKALYYYDTATTQLLRSLQNPDRNMGECATTAVVLNVYEIMSEKPGQRMSHIAGARALIRECGWDARSKGIAAACFWLNIGMEVLSCLAFNWQTAWDPDQWGLDFDFADWGSDNGGDSLEDDPRNEDANFFSAGSEEAWVHRIFYIMAKIANFKANIPRFQEASPHDEEARKRNRFADWKRLRNMCDSWNKKCPRPMRPFGYSHTKSSKSLFPNVWLINRAAVIGRLFYHTAMCLLAQINPLKPKDVQENREAQVHHAHQVCGIVAHTTDRGVASVAIRSLAIASSVLSDRAEQSEVLAILEKINRDTGWRLEKVLIELKKAWGWGTPASLTLAPVVPGGAVNPSTHAPVPAPPQFFQQPQQPPPTRAPVNPILAQADFSLPIHPYQNWYKPPNRTNAYNAHGF